MGRELSRWESICRLKQHSERTRSLRRGFSVGFLLAVKFVEHSKKLTQMETAIQSVIFFPILGFNGFIIAMYLASEREKKGENVKNFSTQIF